MVSRRSAWPSRVGWCVGRRRLPADGWRSCADYAELGIVDTMPSSGLCRVNSPRPVIFGCFQQTRLGIVWAASSHGCWSDGNSIRLLL